MANKYLYLDDESFSTLKALTSAVSGRKHEVEIDIVHPASFHDNIHLLLDQIKRYNGLILDWRLDIFEEGQTNVKFDFRAAALAQEIRTRAAERTVVAIPIVLWSTQTRLAGSYTGDHTSHDLFDRCYDKDEISENAQQVRLELISLVNGYKTIQSFLRSNPSLEKLLGINASLLDVRIQKRFQGDPVPAYEYARFVLRELIERPGPLISEPVLAARLGIDIVKSEYWKNLLAKIEKYKYEGPFSDAWPRWWAYGIEREWWFSLVKGQHPLSVLTAEERVGILKRTLRLSKLVFAIPIKQNYHSRYYTICEHCQSPLDPLDGVVISEKEPEPWQERRYISLDVALERKSEKYIPHPTEIERIKGLRRGDN